MVMSEARGLRTSFGDHVVLDGVDLKVAEGAIYELASSERRHALEATAALGGVLAERRPHLFEEWTEHDKRAQTPTREETHETGHCSTRLNHGVREEPCS